MSRTREHKDIIAEVLQRPHPNGCLTKTAAAPT
jgi:hypothetical protein